MKKENSKRGKFLGGIFKKIWFLIKFGAILALLLVLEDIGGMKIIILISIAFVLVVVLENRKFIEEWVSDLLIKIIR